MTSVDVPIFGAGQVRQTTMVELELDALDHGQRNGHRIRKTLRHAHECVRPLGQLLVNHCPGPAMTFFAFFKAGRESV